MSKVGKTEVKWESGNVAVEEAGSVGKKYPCDKARRRRVTYVPQFQHCGSISQPRQDAHCGIRLPPSELGDLSIYVAELLARGTGGSLPTVPRLPFLISLCYLEFCNAKEQTSQLPVHPRDDTGFRQFAWPRVLHSQVCHYLP
jgi:hypothetical protein